VKSKDFRRLLRRVEDEIAAATVEHAVVYDKRGIEVLRKVGTRDEVEFTEEERSLLPGCTLVHNHPDETLENGVVVRSIPPSITDDLGMLLVDQPAEIRTVTREFQFTLRAASDLRFPSVEERLESIRDEWASSRDRLRGKRAEELDRLLAARAITDSERELAIYEGISEDGHRAWLAGAKRNQLFYRRERRRV